MYVKYLIEQVIVAAENPFGMMRFSADRQPTLYLVEIMRWALIRLPNRSLA